MGVGGQRHAPAALPPGMSRYPLYRRLGGPVWTGAENLVPTVIRSPDRPARSESLYRLSYPSPPYQDRSQYYYCGSNVSVLDYAPHHKGKWRTGGITLPILTSALDGGEWFASQSCCFTLREQSPQHQLNTRLGNTQIKPGRFGGNVSSPPGIQIHRLVTKRPKSCWLHNYWSKKSGEKT